ncbi:tetratricopeptide repeat protein [Zavarzinia sp. CC-PAN008]|uniref:tetratricopeptide repeat protein n=1 Tax=Zavarzinia sp. CC-PAN008 TaxID=3243332 RepID=UPI003F742FF4
MTSIRRAPALAVLAALAIGGCQAPGPAGGPALTADAANGAAASRARGPILVADRSPFGSYLAGLYAGAQNDPESASDFFASVLDADPDNLALVRRAFLLKLSDGQVDRAVPYAQRLVEAKTDEPAAVLTVAVDLVAREEWAKVGALLDANSKDGTLALFGPVLRAWALAGEGKHDAALQALDALTEKSAFEPFRVFQRGLILDQAGRSAEALAEYKVLVDSPAGHWVRAVEAYGGALERANRRDEALAVYDAFLKDSPTNPLILAAKARVEAKGKPPRPLATSPRDGVGEALYAAGSVLSQDGTQDLAERSLRLARFAKPDLAIATSLLADLMEDTGRMDDALDLFRELSRDPILGWNARLRAALVLTRQKRQDEAVTDLRAMIAERPQDLEAAVALADTLREAEKFADAAIQYDTAIRLAGTPQNRHWVLFYARGVSRERTKQWDAAEADFRKALELSPDQPLVLNYLGYSWVEQGRNLPEAQAMIERAVALRPNDGYIVDSLGWVLFKQGKYEDAVERLERAVTLEPQDPVINDHLGDALWQVGRRMEARFQWNHALNLSPEPEQESDLKRKLDRGLMDQTASNP